MVFLLLSRYLHSSTAVLEVLSFIMITVTLAYQVRANIPEAKRSRSQNRTVGWIQAQSVAECKDQKCPTEGRRGKDAVTEIFCIFKFEPVFSYNLFLVAWGCFWPTPFTIRECRTYCQDCRTYWTDYPLPPTSVSSRKWSDCKVTVTCYKERAYIHTVTFSGTESNASLLVAPVLSFLFWPPLLITGLCQYFFRSWGGGVTWVFLQNTVLTAMMKGCIWMQKQAKGTLWGDHNDLLVFCEQPAGRTMSKWQVNLKVLIDFHKNWALYLCCVQISQL